MKCTQIKEKFSDYLIGDLDDSERDLIQEHVTACDTCREELESLSAIWTKLGVLPEEQPSDRVRTRFYAMLEKYKESPEKKRQKSFLRKLANSWSSAWIPARPAFQIVPALLFLVVGLTAGYFLHANLQRGKEIEELQQEVSHIRQVTEVSMILQEFMSEQLRAAGWEFETEQPEQGIRGGTLSPLERDISPDSQAEGTGRPLAFQDYLLFREELVRSISEQTSPLMQIALAFSRYKGSL
jgi:hypothetical protein